MKMLLAGLIVTLVTGCAVQVKTYVNPKVDYSVFESWCWMQGCEIVYQGPEYYKDERVITEIGNAIAWNMYDKGYTQGDDQSDLLLNFYIVMEKDSAEITDLYSNTFQGEREWLPMLYPEYQHFLKGSLVIDVVNRKTSELIWTSTSIKYVEVNPTYDKKAIWSGVKAAMKKFPEN